ncbi:MAG: hypothetical protein EXR49_08425 [Dehalococcoidia bacterium]|nr:hypothetical protein [Dehalococcoidia bacterium]
MNNAMSHGDSTTPEASPPLKYHIDLEWHKRLGRSMDEMIAARLPAGAAAGKGTKKAQKKAPAMADLAKIEGFIGHDLPVLEAVFRLLLVQENKPMDVEQISQELAEQGIGIRDARVVTPASLTRMLDSDRYYGLVRA